LARDIPPEGGPTEIFRNRTTGGFAMLVAENDNFPNFVIAKTEIYVLINEVLYFYF
jgi:hypothetical protein